MVKLHISFIETLVTRKLSLCCVIYVGCKTTVMLLCSWMCGGEEGGMERAQDVAAPPSWIPAFAATVLMCCWAWVTRGLPLAPSRLPQWYLEGFFGCAKMKDEEGTGSCSTASPPDLSPCQAQTSAHSSSQGMFYKENQLGKLKTPQICLHIFIFPHPGSVVSHFFYKSFIKGSPRMTGWEENNLEPNEQLLRVTTINLHNY